MTLSRTYTDTSSKAKRIRWTWPSILVLVSITSSSKSHIKDVIARGYALNTAICASCMSGESERARRYLAQLVDLTIEKGTEHAALSAAVNVRRLLPGNAKADHASNILYEVIRLYTYLEKYDGAYGRHRLLSRELAQFWTEGGLCARQQAIYRI